jgi:protocatechuate 3,4-dioxygenase beta subunit
VSLPEALSPQRHHKPNPGRIGCEEYCCHLTASCLVGVRDHGGRHDRCGGRRHHGKHQGEYDNIGFRYRGHVITGPDGAFRFRTIVPALYTGRTRHYHIKVQAPSSRPLTTQLYFPNEPANIRDVLFQSELLMRAADAGDGLDGQFDFVLNIR